MGEAARSHPACGMTPHPMSLASHRAAFAAYMIFIGAFATQWALYAKEALGFSTGTTGILNAIFLGSIISASLVIGRVADAFQCRLLLQRLLSALGVVVLCFWPFVETVWQMAVLLVIQGWACHVQVAMLDASSVDLLRGDRARYGSVRAFGTIGYAAGVFLVSRLRHGDPRLFLGVAIGALAVFHLVTWWLPRTQVTAMEVRPRLALKTVFKNRPLVILLTTTIAYSAAFAHYEVFGTLHFTELGISESSIGNIYVAGSMAEVLVLFAAAPILKRYRVRHLMAFSMLICAGRWAAMPFVSSALPLLFLQLSHAVCFGLWYAAAVHALGRLVDAEVRTSGQALFSVCFSCGFGLGGFLAGQSRESLGPDATFAMSAALALLAGCVVIGMRHVFDDTALSGDPRHLARIGENITKTPAQR